MTRCCGTTASAAGAAVAGSGPRLWTVIRTRMSSGAALAYSTVDVEVAVVVEDARVEQLVLELLLRPPPVGLHQVLVRERCLRVLVEVAHVRVRGRRVEVEVVLLDVLAVVALAVGEPEQALLEDRVATVPEGEREAQPLPVVGDARDAVLAPAVGARAGLIVAEVVPGVAVGRCSPRVPCPTAAPRGRAPTSSRGRALTGVVQALLLGRRRRTWGGRRHGHSAPTEHSWLRLRAWRLTNLWTSFGSLPGR